MSLLALVEILIPNVVTPYSTSGDNDNFSIPGIQSYDGVEIDHPNRWGNVVSKAVIFGVQPFWDCAADGATWCVLLRVDHPYRGRASCGDGHQWVHGDV